MTDPRADASAADLLVTVGDMGLRPKPRGLWLNSSDPEEVDEWAERHFEHVSQRVLCVMPEGWAEQHPDAAEGIVEALRQRQRHAEIAEHTLKHTTVMHAEFFLRNLRRLESAPWASSIGRPLVGKSAVIVSAGPSLDRNKRHLQDAKDKGAAIITVNTAASALPTCPDVVVCIESKDVSGGLHAWAGEAVHALDISANPTCWDVPAAGHLAIGDHNPPFAPYVVAAGGVPIPAGAGVASAALSLAVWWGAESIALVGQDLSWPGGRCYAEGTAFGDLSASVSGEHVTFAGHSKAMAPGEALSVPAWGGAGNVVTTHVWQSYLTHFARAVAKFPGRITNCTEGGARIAGCTERRLADWVADMPECVPADFVGLAHGGAPAWTDALALAAQEARDVLRAESDMEHGDAVRRCPLLTQWTTPAVLELAARGGMTAAERALYFTAAQRAGAERIVELALD